jgi:uncharacterized membrane protein YhaH (DUF805 family)
MNIFKNYFLDVITKRYFQFSGRASRSEFWYFMLFSIIFSLLITMIGESLGLLYMISLELPMVNEVGELHNVIQDIPINILQTAFSLLFMFPSMAVSVRRLHDIGKSAWWLLIAIIPLLGVLVLLAFHVMGSQESENKHGVSPSS